MSKLSKFVRHPQRFVTDSRTYRKFVLAAGHTLGLDPALDPRALCKHFVGKLSETVRTVDMSSHDQCRVAIVRDDMHPLAEFVHDARERWATIRIRNRRGALNASTATLFAIHNFLCEQSSFQMTIEHSLIGVRHAIAFQTWTRTEEQYVGPENHVIARRIDVGTARKHGLFEVGSLPHLRCLTKFPMAVDVDFPIDVVYTWVNHDDPGWRELWRRTVGTDLEAERTDSRGLERFLNRDELKLSLRSLATYAPWVGNIFVVSNCAPPEWLALSHPQIHWVDHQQVLPAQVLPVFSSHSIESRLHHIPGLADHFLYFNDDVFLTRPTLATDFYESTGQSKSFMEPYGSVHGDLHPESADYLNAARNGRRLIEEAFERTVTALHMHTVHALRRDLLREIENRFEGPVARTTAARFRSIDDVSMVSFLYHHYGYLTGKTRYAHSDALLVNPQTARYEKLLQRLLEGTRLPISLCLNDGGDSSLNRHWSRHVVSFLETFFPTPSPFER